MDHAVSRDLGETWTLCPPCFLDPGIRNPQTAQIDGIYVAHGRAENLEGFVFYFSKDGQNWESAVYAAD